MSSPWQVISFLLRCRLFKIECYNTLPLRNEGLLRVVRVSQNTLRIVQDGMRTTMSIRRARVVHNSAPYGTKVVHKQEEGSVEEVLPFMKTLKKTVQMLTKVML